MPPLRCAAQLLSICRFALLCFYHVISLHCLPSVVPHMPMTDSSLALFSLGRTTPSDGHGGLWVAAGRALALNGLDDLHRGIICDLAEDDVLAV